MSRVQTAAARPKFVSFDRLNDLVDVLELQHAQHGAEDFLTGNPHIVGHAGKQRRLDKVAAVADALAASDHLRAVALADVDVLEDMASTRRLGAVG